jgi:hypothetical protein
MNQINDATKRSIFRWIHIIFGIPIIGYVYSPFEELPNYAPVVRFVALPVILLTGFWMWKGHVDDNIVSVEAYPGESGSPETHGKENVRKKIDWWVNATEIHGFTANGPFVAHDRFVVQYDADVTDKNSKKRFQLPEVGVYTVKDGKIVREEFLPRTGS